MSSTVLVWTYIIASYIIPTRAHPYLYTAIDFVLLYLQICIYSYVCTAAS